MSYLSLVNVRVVNGILVSGEEDGEPVRTKFEYPYSYDPILQYKSSKAEANGTIYSDRLLEWDFPKHDRLCEKHFGNRGQYWDDREPSKIEAFLRDWCEDPNLVLCAVTEYCNKSNGYPCWRLDYYQEPKKS